MSFKIVTIEALGRCHKSENMQICWFLPDEPVSLTDIGADDTGTVGVTGVDVDIGVDVAAGAGVVDIWGPVRVVVVVVVGVAVTDLAVRASVVVDVGGALLATKRQWPIQ